jgi:hypothetical protein
MIKPDDGDDRPGRDRAAAAAVVVLLCARVPCPTDPVLLAAALVRAISAAPSPMTVELCPVPELSRAVWGGSRMLTWALALSATPVRSHARSSLPGDTPAPGRDQLAAAARVAAAAAVTVLCGRGVEMVLQIARTPEQVAACHRALSGTPAPFVPDHRGRVTRTDPYLQPLPALPSMTPKRPPSWAW